MPVLKFFDKVPSLGKAYRKVENGRTHQGERDVVPRHSRSILDRKSVRREFIDRLKIHHSGIIVVLSGEERLFELGWMYVRQGVVMRVPSAITSVQAAHACNFVVDEAKFFVMTPVIDELACSVLRMPHDDDVLV